MSHSHSTETPGQAWPPQRSSREAIQSQFGASRAELALWTLTTGDPLADAVVKERSITVATMCGQRCPMG